MLWCPDLRLYSIVVHERDLSGIESLMLNVDLRRYPIPRVLEALAH